MSLRGYVLLLTAALCCSAAPAPDGKKCNEPDIKNGYMYYNYYFPVYHGRSVDYQCERDYMSHQRTYWGKIQCTDLGWNPEPKCSRQCLNRKASVANAELKDGQNMYLEGEKVKFVCNNNFLTPDGKTDGERTCLPNGEFTPAKCSKTCEAPELPDGIFKPNKKIFEIEEYLQYECNKGFTTVNRKLSSSAWCQHRGWSEEPRCIPVTCTHDRVLYKYGDVIKYRCPPGQRPESELAQCYHSGFYPPRKCLEFNCTISDNVNLTRKPLKLSYTENDRVILECEKGYIKEGPNITTCTANGWTPPLPTCGIGAQCGPPPVVQYGDTISFNNPFYNSTESVEYKCPEYYVLQGNRIVRCLNGVWDEAPVCLEPCTTTEKDMEDNNIKLKYGPNRKFYSKNGDTMEFDCVSGYEAPPGTNMRITCEQGKLQYPKCFKTGFCVLDQPTMTTNNIHYTASTIVDNGQTITFQCHEEMIPENKLEAKCEAGGINYPKCAAASPCKISTEDLNLYNIQLLPSDDPEKILDITHKHGTQLRVTCKSGFRQPTQAALVIECYDGEFRYPRCFAGNTCRIDQEELDRNNLELDEVHDNEVFYEENERVHFKCKTGYYRRTKPIGKCSEETLIYPSCTAQSSG